mmetsp:Transcript_73290/g.157012  ORF Transcript_73290/g.157012 Transcript_73290/m.157012 type:complete len:259 (+) Transcript_73290:4648-5424(+)
MDVWRQGRCRGDASRSPKDPRGHGDLGNIRRRSPLEEYWHCEVGLRRSGRRPRSICSGPSHLGTGRWSPGSGRRRPLAEHRLRKGRPRRRRRSFRGLRGGHKDLREPWRTRDTQRRHIALQRGRGEGQPRGPGGRLGRLCSCQVDPRAHEDARFARGCGVAPQHRCVLGGHWRQRRRLGCLRRGHAAPGVAGHIACPGRRQPSSQHRRRQGRAGGRKQCPRGLWQGPACARKRWYSAHNSCRQGVAESSFGIGGNVGI